MQLRILFVLLAVLFVSQAARAHSEGIGWIPTWKQAWAEATKTRKPILLIAAAPHCGGVPGIW